jgi:hypothetical protein
MKKSIFALALSGAFIFLLAACGGDATPMPTNAPPSTEAPRATATRAASSNTGIEPAEMCGTGEMPAFITGVVLAKETQGANFEPVEIVEAYDPSQATFHAVVTLKNAPKNLQLGSAWHLMQASGYKPQTIDQNTLDIPDGGSRNVDFTLKAVEPLWPVGSYCVSIFANGKLAVSKPFEVIGSSATSNAGAEVVQDIVLAENTKPDTFEPINPTTMFKTNAQAIHAAVSIQDAPANTFVSAKWYPPDQLPLEFNLPPVDGTRWLDFRLDPPSEGFPTGEYKVEIYVNEKLVDTKTFTVQ